MDKKRKSRNLRKLSTPEEHKLWLLIKDNQLGYKFRRQVAIGNFIVDFCCFKKRLIVELYGSPHKRLIIKLKDRKRTEYLESQDFKVLIVWNWELNYSRLAINKIKFYLNNPSSALRASSPARLPDGQARGEEKRNK